ncbi:MAG: ribosomal protein S18-alanine N-acetyltransferase [Proteobacteria bacterium]|nr:ribosomal protein S18-alanine N-acetyltransferase [Pseudomonadota bacterium]
MLPKGCTAPPVLRTLRATDAGWLAELHAECFDEKRRWPASFLASFLQNPAAFGGVYLSQTEPVGFILGQGAAEEAEIVTLATRPAFQRQGIAAMLVEDFCTFCHKQGKNRIFLEVAENNLPAIALYRKLGFEKQGIRPNYYQEIENAVDAWVMIKLL